MNKTILNLQNKVIKFLKACDNNLPLNLLSEINCSEISRLVGCWVLEKKSSARVYILKGTNIKFGKNKSHDILMVYKSDKIYLIDPTVWQFFKNKKSILIKETNNLLDALMHINKIYGGKWNISENITKTSYKDMNDWKNLIRINISSI